MTVLPILKFGRITHHTVFLALAHPVIRPVNLALAWRPSWGLDLYCGRHSVVPLHVPQRYLIGYMVQVGNNHLNATVALNACAE